ncbi:MAG: AAA family ATPase, partial [Planctomycetes bacterium]|nr:AAA family ATPase [Planctomycetota bacterium]
IASALDEENLPLVNRLANRFGVADMLTGNKDSVFMASLLYFFGVLTMGGQTLFGELILCIPNLTIRQLYVENIRELILPTAADMDHTRLIARTFFQNGDLQPLCDFVEAKFFGVLDNRDYRWANELTVKMAFLTLLFNDMFYIVDSEPALGRDYADLILIVRPDKRHTPLPDFLLEFKYVSLKKVDLSGKEVRAADTETLRALPDVADALTDAQEQLNIYRQKLNHIYNNKLNLRSYAVVAI